MEQKAFERNIHLWYKFPEDINVKALQPESALEEIRAQSQSIILILVLHTYVRGISGVYSRRATVEGVTQSIYVRGGIHSKNSIESYLWNGHSNTKVGPGHYPTTSHNYNS